MFCSEPEFFSDGIRTEIGTINGSDEIGVSAGKSRGSTPFWEPFDYEKGEVLLLKSTLLHRRSGETFQFSTMACC